jgi:transcriptional regulator with XRE-family HTH domain
MFNKKNFVKRLNTLMENNKTSQQSLEDAIGVSRVAVSQFAHGANLPSIEKIVRIADYFHVSIDYLLGLSDNPHRP